MNENKPMIDIINGEKHKTDKSQVFNLDKELVELTSFQAPIHEQEALSKVIVELQRLNRDLLNNAGLIEIQRNIQVFYDKGWTKDRLLKKAVRFEDMALFELLDKNDKIKEITEDFISIEKASGQIHYYEKNYGHDSV